MVVFKLLCIIEVNGQNIIKSEVKVKVKIKLKVKVKFTLEQATKAQNGE